MEDLVHFSNPTHWICQFKIKISAGRHSWPLRKAGHLHRLACSHSSRTTCWKKNILHSICKNKIVIKFWQKLTIDSNTWKWFQIFWGIYIFAQSFDFYNYVLELIRDNSFNWLSFTTFTLGLLFSAVSFICHFFVEPAAEYDEPSKDPNQCPEQSSSFPTKMTLGWFNGLVHSFVSNKY